MPNKLPSGIDHLSDSEAILELSLTGAFTLENLDDSYLELKRRGMLDVPVGQPKELTEVEKLKVISLIRTGNTDQASSDYLRFALGCSPPNTTGADIFTKYPDLCRRAVYFIFQEANASTIDRKSFQNFFERIGLITSCFPLSGYWNKPGPNIQMDKMVEAEHARDNPAPEPPKQLTDADYAQMSDEEITAKLAEERKAYLLALRSRRP